MLGKSIKSFSQRGDGLLGYKVRLCVPDGDNLSEQIQEEAHGLRYWIHLGDIKM